jgi:hypothetical protein
MGDKEAFGYLRNQEEKTTRGKGLGGAAILFALVAFGCSGGGEKSTAGKTEPKTVVQETVVPTPVAPTPVAPKTVAPPPPATKKPEARTAPQAELPPPSLGMTPEEFRLRFNKTSEFVKSKLRIKKLNIVAGSAQDTFKHIFTENLYLTGEVNKENGSLAEVNFAGVLNGSLATTVDLNVCFGTIITAFSPRLSPDERDSVLYDLGITNKDVDIYTLNRKVTKNGITYWVKSSRATGIRFGARSANGN